MKTLEQIKNEYAVSKGFICWSHLLSSTSMLDEHINEVMKIYAMECLKLASENAFNKDVYIGYGEISEGKVKESITNENNIIK